MITLTTLPQASAQEVFDQVAIHLLTQGEKSVNGESCFCRYKSDNNLKCAAGCLIADEEYVPKMDSGYNWHNLVAEELVPDNHCNLIRQLQIIHDQTNVEDWAKDLKNRAMIAGLSTKVVDEFVR